MAFLAQVTYTGNGSTTQYSIPFEFIDSTHVKAFIDGTETSAFTISSSTLTFTTAPANASVVRIERQTPTDARLIDFTDGSVLTESDLDRSADQNFYIAQEITDDSASKLGLDTDDKYDANNKVIKNLANPVNNNDAVNKTYLENTWLSPANKTALTTVNANIANINAVNANEANINSVNSNEANINTVAGQISPTNNISTLVSINSDITNVANNNTDISTVAGEISPTNNISTVAGLDTEIQGVYNIRTNVTNVDGNSANINLVAGQISPTNNISTLANLDTELSAIYGIRNNITNVDTNSTNINLVAGQISPTNNINTLGNLSSQLTTLGALGTEITNLNTIRTDISTVAGQISPTNNISTLSGLNTEISALYNIRTDITAVANISTDIQDVQDKIAELQTVANDLNEATSEIETVAGSINQVDAVGNDLLGANNIGTVATNLSGVNYFGERYRVSATAPTTSLDVGDLYYDTSTDAMKVYGSSGWQNAGSSVNGTSQRYNYTATSGQTTFTGADNNGNTLTYDAGYIDVYLNGVKLLNGTDVTVTSGSSVVLASGATTGDVVDIVAYGTFSVASLNADNLDSGTVPDARITGAYTGITNLTMSGDLTVDTTTLKVDSSNNRVGIGTSSPAKRLHVVSGTTDDGVRIESTDLRALIGTLDNTGSTYFGGSGADFVVYTGGDTAGAGSSEKMRIDSSGNLGIGTTSPSQKLDVVGSIEVSDGIYLGGTGTANKLDDYEEGTWTPSYSFETSGSAVSTAYFGSYVKIGKIVHLSGGLLTNSVSSPTGNAIVVGLPFAASSLTSADFAGSLTQVRRFASSMTDLRVEVSGGTSGLRFYKNTTSANNFSLLQGSDFNTANAQNIMFFNVTYETD